MRILIIDDDEESQYLLRSYFQSEGYDVWVASSSIEGLQKVKSGKPDLVILDVQLPEISGGDVCRRIRAFSDIPILMISAYARDNVDIIRGLNAGADDYLPKPIDFDVMKARVIALLRRSMWVEWRNSHPAYIDPYLTVDLQRNQVQIEGQSVSLSPLEFRLMALLVRNANQIVPSLEIVETLWPHVDPDDYIQYVHTYIKRLRATIEPDSKNPRYLITEHGMGYRFAPQSG